MSEDFDVVGSDNNPGLFPIGPGSTVVSRRKYALWQNTGDNKLLWDITLVSADGKRFHANRLELASWSEYFCSIFCGDYAETKQKLLKLPDDVSGEALELLMQGVHSQEIPFNRANIEDMLRVTDRLQVTSIKDACICYLDQEMSSYNVMETLLLADKYSCQQLELAARHFIRQNFEQVVQWDIEHAEHGGIAHLGQSTLLQILTDNELAVKSEMNVFTAIKQWILAQPVQSSGMLYEMMQAVRLEQMPGDTLQTLLQDDLVKADVQCSQMVAHAALQIAGTPTNIFPPRPVRNFSMVYVQNIPMIKVWKITGWSAVQRRMKEGERIYSEKFPIPGVRGQWKFDFFPKGTTGADGWMSLYFKYAEQFADGESIGFGFKLHVINFGIPSHTLTKVYEKQQCTFSADSPGWGHQKMAPINQVSDVANGFLVGDCIYIGISKIEIY